MSWSSRDLEKHWLHASLSPPASETMRIRSTRRKRTSTVPPSARQRDDPTSTPTAGRIQVHHWRVPLTLFREMRGRRGWTEQRGATGGVHAAGWTHTRLMERTEGTRPNQQTAGRACGGRTMESTIYASYRSSCSALPFPWSSTRSRVCLGLAETNAPRQSASLARRCQRHTRPHDQVGQGRPWGAFLLSLSLWVACCRDWFASAHVGGSQ